jgi:hypothetical protein
MFFKYLTRIALTIIALGMNNAVAMSSSQSISGVAQEASSRSVSAPIVPHVEVTDGKKENQKSYSKVKKIRTPAKPYDKPKAKQPAATQIAENKDTKTSITTTPKQPQHGTITAQNIREVNDMLTQCVNSIIEERIIDGNLKMAVLKLDGSHAAHLFNLFHNPDNLILLEPSTVTNALVKAHNDGFDLAVLIIIAHLLTQTIDPQARNLNIKASKVILPIKWLSTPLNNVLTSAFSLERIDAAIDQAIALKQWEALGVLLEDKAISRSLSPHRINGIFMQAAITYGITNIVQIIANTETLGSQLTADARAYVYNYVKRNEDRDMIEILDAALYGKPAST